MVMIDELKKKLEFLEREAKDQSDYFNALNRKVGCLIFLIEEIEKNPILDDILFKFWNLMKEDFKLWR